MKRRRLFWRENWKASKGAGALTVVDFKKIKDKPEICGGWDAFVLSLFLFSSFSPFSTFTFSFSLSLVYLPWDIFFHTPYVFIASALFPGMVQEPPSQVAKAKARHAAAAAALLRKQRPQNRSESRYGRPRKRGRKLASPRRRRG